MGRAAAVPSEQIVASGTNKLSELGALFHVIFITVPDVSQMI